MKIILAIDGSKYSQAAIDEMAGRPWPAGSTVRILFVCVPFPYNPFFDPEFVGNANGFDKVTRERAFCDADAAAAQIRKKLADVTVEIEVVQGSPKKMIVEEAERWGADLIILGSHGYGPIHRFLLGSVAQAVAFHAPCSVEIVRSRS
jgi:nucleotide-binding universal stress UspA family protein